MAEYTPYPVELITPEGAAYADDAQQVIAPGAAGKLGILANHAPLVSLLNAGELHIIDAGGAVHRYRDLGGFLQVRENRALVLVGEAVHPTRSMPPRPGRGWNRPRQRWKQPKPTTSNTPSASWPSRRRWFKPPPRRTVPAPVVSSEPMTVSEPIAPARYCTNCGPTAAWQRPGSAWGLRARVRHGGGGGRGAARAVGG